MTDLVFHELRIRLRSLIGWSLGLSFFGLLYLFSYPQLSDVLADLDVKQVPIYQAFGQSNFSTFESFLASSVINFLPVLLGIYAIIDGTKTLVGEEEMGTLELLVTLPLRRWQVTAAKALAMSVIVFTVLLISGLSMWAGLAIIRSQVESSVTGLSLLVATLNA